MDSDVVLQADVTLLAKLDMGGYPVAAVEDCSQHFAPWRQELSFDELLAPRNAQTNTTKDLYIDFDDTRLLARMCSRNKLADRV